MWLRNLASVRALTALLSAFGTLWLVVSVGDYFFRDTGLPERLRSLWWLFAAAGVLIAILMCRPRTLVEHRLAGRDVTVEIAVSDVFALPGAVIVGSNTTFDTAVSRTLISEHSIQGAFTRKYYAEASQLDIELAAGLNGVEPVELGGPRVGKSKRYPVGTVVRLDPQGRTAYFVAIANINEHGVAESDFEMLKASLAELWVYVGSRGLKERLVVPALGTGFSRLTQTREEVVRETVLSFVAACSERVFTDRLTIVLSPRDVVKNSISLEELGNFLRHVCTYTDFSGGVRRKVGLPA